MLGFMNNEFWRFGFYNDVESGLDKNAKHHFINNANNFDYQTLHQMRGRVNIAPAISVILYPAFHMMTDDARKT
jgi:transcription-repair coupling factor (superfamily II helicase)